MPTERMEEVEVEVASCASCGGTMTTIDAEEPCCVSPSRGVDPIRGLAHSGSLTAARLRLADAAEAREVAHRKRMARIEMGLDCSVDREYLEALAAEEDAEDQEVEAFEALAALRTARGEG